MNFPKIKRRIMHIFFLTCLILFFATPVFAVTVDVASPDSQTVIPVTKPMALTTPTPPEPGPEFVGPQKPEDVELETSSPTPSPTSSQSASLVTPTPTPIKSGPTITPTATPTISPTAPPAQTGSNTSTGGLNADVLFSMSNNYRTGRGLPPFQKDERVCNLAAVRAPEIGAEISEGHMHSGKNSHNFPYWFTENIISMSSEESAFNWWVNDPIHHDAIVGAYSHSCVACSGNACVQEFTSFQAK